MPCEEICFERQQAQDPVTGFPQHLDATLPPGPYRRTDVMHGRYARTARGALDRQIKVWRVDADQDIGRVRAQAPHDLTPDAEQPGQMPRDLEQAHDGQVLAVEPCAAACGPHGIARDAFEPEVGVCFAGGPDQAGAELITGGLSRNNDDPGHRVRESLADQAALGAFQKLHEYAEFGLFRNEPGELFRGLVPAQPGTIEYSVGFLEILDIIL